jgi:hypothetical protein
MFQGNSGHKYGPMGTVSYKVRTNDLRSPSEPSTIG